MDCVFFYFYNSVIIYCLKAKVNAAQAVGELIQIAENKSTSLDYNAKHGKITFSPCKSTISFTRTSSAMP